MGIRKSGARELAAFGGGMTLAIMASGFGRTGTMSMKMALGNSFGFGPCHHMMKLIGKSRAPRAWGQRSRRANKSRWAEVFKGYPFRTSTGRAPPGYGGENLDAFSGRQGGDYGTAEKEGCGTSFRRDAQQVL